MNKSLFKKVDCIRLYVSDLQESLEYYEKTLGQKMVWKTERTIGFGMDEDNTEFVLHSSTRKVKGDFMVDSVVKAIEDIKESWRSCDHWTF
ncbi:MAG: VOC family protein [Thermotogota bacterium]|nr:VOC family protein [Thermotogota bacterium]